MSSKNRTQAPDQDRRRFIAILGGAASGIALAGIMPEDASAASLPMVAETEPLAISMGYKADTAKVDPKKFATHKPVQTCANCKLYQGKVGDTGPCPIFAGKAVTAKGWCVAWVKK